MNVGGPAPGSAGAFAPGRRFGRYLLEDQIGKGGMAVVFRAVDEGLDRLVALKVLPSGRDAADGELRQRFIRESRAAARVGDPNIIPVYDAGEVDGVLYIAMQLIQGGDVGSQMTAGRPLPVSRAASIISAVASALDAAHQRGLVHRDVKPGNILLDVRPGRPDHVYLSDFGISKNLLATSPYTHTNQFLGTLAYAAPEQFGTPELDGRADQYALACVAFELLGGSPPFMRTDFAALMAAHLRERPPRLSQRRPGVGAQADAVLTRALAKDRDDRYVSCTAFAGALRSALGLPPYDARTQDDLSSDDARLFGHVTTQTSAPAGPVDAPPIADQDSGPRVPGSPDVAPGVLPGELAPVPQVPVSSRRRVVLAVGTAAVLAAAGAGVVLATRGTASPPASGRLLAAILRRPGHSRAGCLRVVHVPARSHAHRPGGCCGYRKAGPGVEGPRTG